MDRPRDPELAARLFGGKPEHTLALLRAAWPGAVGEELARRTELVGLDRGILRVKVPDLRWQRQLLRVRGLILGRLRQIAGQAAPRGVGFVTGEVKGESGPGGPATGNVPDSAAPPSASPPPGYAPPPGLVDAAAAIPDPEVRERFLAAAARYLARFGELGQTGSDGPGGETGGGAGA
jgi:hypothetical protein